MVALLEEAIAAHGGSERWEALESLRIGLRSGGLAFRVKGQPRAMRDSDATVSTRGQHVLFEPFPEPGHRGVFTGSEARIETLDGDVLARTERPRGLTWSAVDMLAFAGSALWTYVSFPFVLTRPGFEVRELSGRRLAVTVPPDIRTHSRRHVLWIGDDGLIRRQDYTAEAFGPWARAANVVLAHGQHDGITLATRRRVTPRAFNRPLPGPLLVWIELSPGC